MTLRSTTAFRRQLDLTQHESALTPRATTMQAVATPAAAEPQLPYYIAALLDGASWSAQPGQGVLLRYAFNSSDVNPTFRPFNTAEQAVVEQALSYYAAVSGLRFERAERLEDAHLRFGFWDLSAEKAAGMAGQPVIGGYSQLAFDDDFSKQGSFRADQPAAWHILLHELGHALGLSHPAHYPDTTEVGVSPVYDASTLPQAEDYNSNSNMSYVADAGFYDGGWQFLRPFDIAAIQYLYGVNTALNAGNTHYYFDQLAWPGTLLADGSGHDTLDFSRVQLTSGSEGSKVLGATINLQPGQRSFLQTQASTSPAVSILEAGQVSINYGTVIEVAIGTAGNDWIQSGDWLGLGGTYGGYQLQGGAGNDLITAGDGNDSLYGGAGNDLLMAGAGDDLLVADAGLDTLTGGLGRDVFAIAMAATGSRITEFKRSEGDLLDLYLSDEDKLLMTVFAGFAWAGQAQGGFQGMRGELAPATATQQTSLWWFADEAGNANIYADLNRNGVVDAADFQLQLQGVKSVLQGDFTTSTFALGHIANLSTAATLHGGAGNDTLYGSNGDDLLLGEAGDDQLYGGAGNDTLEGGDGLSDLRHSQLLLGGAGNDLLRGGNAASQLQGDAGDDTLFGGNQADTLSGGAGRDQLNAGAGDDVVLAAAGDTVTAGAGFDTIVLQGGMAGATELTVSSMTDSILLADFDASEDLLDLRPMLATAEFSKAMWAGSVAIVLRIGEAAPANPFGAEYLPFWLLPESLEQTGRYSLYADSNRNGLIDGDDFRILIKSPSLLTAANFIAPSFAWRTGGAGNDVLIGDSYRDSILGGLGDDTLQGGNGNDELLGAAGNDSLLGGLGNDYLSGDEGRDRLNGGGGADSLYGGEGDDYLESGFGALYDSAQQRWIDGAGDWLDGGAGNDTLLGHDGHDSLYGGQGNDSLRGGLGNDLLEGGAGKDILNGGSGADRLFGGDGDDVLSSGVVLDAVSGKWLDGLGDLLDGGAGKDTLLGSDGNDTLIGGAGDDSLNGGEGLDTVVLTASVLDVQMQMVGASLRLTAADGVDVLSAVEQLSFSGRLLRLGTNLLVGSERADTLIGSAGRDTLVGNAGDDLLAGGDGLDLAIYYGRFADYKISAQGNGFVLDGLDGKDSLQQIERLHFADQSIALDIAQSGGMTYRLYQAAFDRAPDLDGLGYWIAAADHGVAMRDIANSFLQSAEFARLYGAAPSDEAYLTALYRNVLHRAPDAEGYAWWLNTLSHGADRAEVLLSFSESVENQTNLITIIGNGFAYTPWQG